jgi:hypothetical protein
LSSTKLKGVRPRALTATGLYVPWRLTAARAPESVRWEHVDGRWVAVTIGHGADIGFVVVTSSSGRRERVATYEGALELARRWRD